MIKLSDFDYTLPKELIAQYPLKKRDSARLMVIDRRKKTITHAVFKDLSGYLVPGDVLVLNNTRVLPAALNARRSTGGRVQILLLSRKRAGVFNALIKPYRVKENEKVFFDGSNIFARISARKEVVFSTGSLDQIYGLGSMPLPPYIKRLAQKSDDTFYQTVFAQKTGSIASPTAGLHFTKTLLDKIKRKGAKICYITLHISYATFKPVKCEIITEHTMEKENFYIPSKTAVAIENAKKNGARVVCVGTTSLRALESQAMGFKRETDLFVYPGYKFKTAEALLTNFHLPKTTLFILACAFAGEKFLKKAYQEAVKHKYRFYSYGDAMLIL
jgi:S-adenosylmethionine:tRNA ribosyltransferase-isomerase